MTENNYDLIVVGAGPSGCAAALRAAQQGLRAAIIERTRFPRDVPGESLHAEINTLLSELGVTEAIENAGFIRNPGWMLEQNNDTHYVPFGKPQKLAFGYQAWRADLDQLLLEAAIGAGAECLQETDARELRVSDGRVMGVETSVRELRAGFVIDGTGPRRWLSQKLSVKPDYLSPKLVARYGYSHQDFGLGVIPKLCEHENGWTWLAKVQENTWQCVQLSLVEGEEIPPPPPEFGFPERMRGADVTWRLLRESAGPGFFVCGDAAAVLDPGASRGVARALQSGIRAADLAAAVVNGEIEEKAALSEYKTWLSRSFIEEANQLAERYTQWKRAPEWTREFSRKYILDNLDS